MDDLGLRRRRHRDGPRRLVAGDRLPAPGAYSAGDVPEDADRQPVQGGRHQSRLKMISARR
ncbi:hypothetical protein RHECNPAF_850063 [Rhizobium etli CNPAF512]|nr:hypothetical protein RHECNPAF_850063 [Rhizobium etli CNPAF512]